MNWYDQLHIIGPAFTLLAGAAVVLGTSLISPRANVRALSLLVLLAAGVYAITQAMRGVEGSALSGTVAVDAFSLFFAVLITAVTAAVVVMTAEGFGGVDAPGEFFALMLASAGSMVLLAQARDLITIFVALETTSICQFILAALARDDRSAEAGLKYLLSGAIAAAVLLYGFAFLYGLSGTTALGGIAQFVAAHGAEQREALIVAFVLVAAGIGFKLALVPFQAWVPDVYQGAPTPVTGFLAVASKAAGFAVVLRLFYTGLGGGGTAISTDWAALFAVLAGVSMTFGNAAALMQTNVKRLLGYSSIAQAGNIAVGLAAVAAGSAIGASAVLFYLAAYAATNLGAFLCVMVVSRVLRSDDLRAYAGLGRRAPVLTGALGLCLLSLTGIPPTAGFLAKLYIFNSAVHSGPQWMVWLVVVAVFNTALSAAYYLRWLRTMVLDEPAEHGPVVPRGATQAALALAVAGVLFIGLLPTPLIDAARRAAQTLV